MNLRQANIEDISVIQEIAEIAFRETYSSILSAEQLSYMLDMMYSTSSLERQLREGQEFILLSEADTYLGFVSYEANFDGKGAMKLHKLYLLPQYKGRGLGRILVEAVLEKGRELEAVAVRLNMNRNNQTYDFYTHIGFVVVGEEDIDIGRGYLMEDYIFEKTL